MASVDNSWSISVKAIGGASKRSNAEEGDCENFTVTVSPEDYLASLYDQIEGITGLKASQQRLIYRGRLIGGSTTEEGRNKLEIAKEEPKIKDIVGLGDGQTIHLVKKHESIQSTQVEREANTSSNVVSPPSSTSERDSDSLNGNGTASLLAALIGLGGLEGGDSSEPAPNAGQRQRIGWRSSRLSRNRRPHYRLTSEDLEIPDPGSVEPVRQGLMTLHTLLPHAQTDTEEDMPRSPLNANRRWYRGQWIDCRDTVNQWLEATIVEIVKPDDILPPRNDSASDTGTVHEITEPASDPAVGANDLDGRRHLLLEPCAEDDGDNEGGELSGFKRRKNNDEVQLLLVHYNGWPHRWDEWIRSDSERIRPFRTRTRHPTMSTHASPTPLSVFSEAPPTFIRSEDAAVERASILPELCRVVTAVNELLNSALSDENNSNLEQAVSRNDNTPWAVQVAPEEPDQGEEEATVEHSDEAPERSSQMNNAGSASCHNGLQNEMLPPLLDRLGRVLIDAAPHFASTLPNAQENSTGAPVAASDSTSSDSEDNPSTLGGLLSLLGRDRRRQSHVVIAGDSVSSETNNQVNGIDPDYADFATGFVNTSRGEVRSGPRGRGQNDDMAGLLGAYLAAASLGGIGSGDTTENGSTGDDNSNNMMGLGRLLRERGNTGSGAGIDIHIHAVVTAPGVTHGGGLNFATVGGPPTTNTAARNILTSARERRGSGSLLRLRTPSVLEDDDDDTGLFSELYSENPDPLNPTVVEESDNSQTGGEMEVGSNETSNESDHDFISRLTSPRQNSSLPIVRTDSFSVPSSRLSRSSSSDTSSRRDSGASPRRSSVLGRFFRRSRRSNN